MTVTDIGGSGTKADWVIRSPGTQGPTGATGATGSTGATGAGVPTGGSTGQVLKKNSNADYDTVWGAAPRSTGSGYKGRRLGRLHEPGGSDPGGRWRYRQDELHHEVCAVLRQARS